jgi:thermitase
MKRILMGSCVAVLLVSLVATARFSHEARAQQLGTNLTEPTYQFVPGRVLVKFRSEVLPEHARQVIAALGARDASEIPEIGLHVLELPYQAGEMAFVRAFQGRPEVEFAELDQILLVQQTTPNDPFYLNPNAWALQKISAPDAWALNTGSETIIIAILDTGVDGTHEDLAAKMVPGWNIYNNNADTSDVFGHGTAVAGTAAAATNNSIGVASVAWGCRIMPVRVSDISGYASISDIANGLTWAANHGARVANISFNATGYSTVSSAARYFQDKGGVVAIAAGNEGMSTQNADNPYILTVGATDSSDVLCSWSNRGNNLDVVAPGHVATTGRGGTYVAADGTSFAAPIVAGAAALVLSTNPGLTPSQVQNIIKQSADDLGATGWDSTYGYGRINLARALTTAPGSGSNGDTIPPSTVIASPVDGGTVAGMVGVSVTATDNVAVTKVELYVDGVLYGTSVNSPFTIKWNTRKAAKGAHSILSKAYDAAGNVGTSPAGTVYK